MKEQTKEKEIEDRMLLRVIKEPRQWELMCPECNERVNVFTLLESGSNPATLREFVCYRHPLCFMVLKPIRSNIRGLLFLIWEVARSYLWRK